MALENNSFLESEGSTLRGLMELTGAAVGGVLAFNAFPGMLATQIAAGALGVIGGAWGGGKIHDAVAR